jgi:hypothetical protein
MDNWNCSMPSSRQGILPSMTRMLPNKSQPFSIVWADDTDSTCDLPCLLTYLDNFASKRHNADAMRSPATSRSASDGAAAPSSLPSSSSLPQPSLFASNVPAAAPAPTAGVFAENVGTSYRACSVLRLTNYAAGAVSD